MLKDRLITVRKNKGLSQYEAAERLGYSRGKLSNYEQGSRQPDNKTLNELADFYEVTTDYLLGRSEDSRLTEKQDKEINEKVKKINDLIESLPEDIQEEKTKQILAFAKYITDANTDDSND